MDPDDLRRHARESLQFTAAAGGAAGATFTLTVPTRLHMQLCLLEAAGPGYAGGKLDAAARLRYRRLELLRAVIGWNGVRERHIAPGAGDAPQPFDASLVELLLDAQPDWEDALGEALLAEQEKRAVARDTAEKN